MAAAGLANGMVKVFDLAATDPAKAERRAITATAAPSTPSLPARSAADPRRLGRQDRHALAASRRPAPKTLAGHTGQIYGVAWSPDGKLAATGAADKSCRLWDVAKGAQVRIDEGPRERRLRRGLQPQGRPARDRRRRQAGQVLERRRRQGAAQERTATARRSTPSPSAPTGPSSPRARSTRRSASGTSPTARSCTSSTATPTTSMRSPSAPTASGWPRSATAATSTSGTSPAPSPCSTSTSPYTMTYGLAWSPDGTQLAVAASDNKVYLLKMP